MKRGAVVFLVLVLALVGAGRAGERYVNIGLNVPLTGPYSLIGLDELRAARLAAEEINTQGGILGRKVRLVITNSASDPFVTRMNIRRLIMDHDCQMVFGGSSSAVAIASCEEAQKFNRIFFGTLTYSTSTTWEKGHRVCFRECYNSWMGAKALATWLNEHYRGRRFVYITADYTWGWTTEESIRKVSGTTDRNVHRGYLVPLGASDYWHLLSRIKKDPPDVLVLVLFGSDLVYAIKQADEIGLKDETQIVVPNLVITFTEGTGIRAMEGVVGTLSWMWKIPFLYGYEEGKRFVRRYTERFNRYPTSAGASAYTILYEYKAAVERAASFRTEKVVRALEGRRFEFLKGPEEWRAFDHQAIQTVYVVRGNPERVAYRDPYLMDFFEVLYRMDGNQAAISRKEWERVRRRHGLPPHLERFPDEVAP